MVSKLNDTMMATEYTFADAAKLQTEMQTAASAIATASNESKVLCDMLSLHYYFGCKARGAGANELPDVKPFFDAWHVRHYADGTGRKALAESTEENYRSSNLRFATLGFHWGLKGQPVAEIVIDEPKLKPQERAKWITSIVTAFPDTDMPPTKEQVFALKPEAAPKHVRDVVEDIQAALHKAVGEKGKFFEAGSDNPVRAILRADAFAAMAAYVNSLPTSPKGGIDYAAQAKKLRSDYQAARAKKDKK
jgi:hypothetical protein